MYEVMSLYSAHSCAKHDSDSCPLEVKPPPMKIIYSRAPFITFESDDECSDVTLLYATNPRKRLLKWNCYQVVFSFQAQHQYIWGSYILCMSPPAGRIMSNMAVCSPVSFLPTFLVPMTTIIWRTATWFPVSYTSATLPNVRMLKCTISLSIFITCENKPTLKNMSALFIYCFLRKHLHIFWV